MESARFRMITLLFGLGLGLGACFSDTGSAVCQQGNLGCACTVGECQGELVCRMDYCVNENCVPGEKYCTCYESMCAPDLECVDDAVCLPPGGADDGPATSGETSGSTTSPGSTSSTTVDPSETGTAGSGDTGPAETGSMDGCGSNDECADTEFCDFPDNACGDGVRGECVPRPLDGECSNLNMGVTGCDCQMYGSVCKAQVAGVDIKCSGLIMCC